MFLFAAFGGEDDNTVRNTPAISAKAALTATQAGLEQALHLSPDKQAALETVPRPASLSPSDAVLPNDPDKRAALTAPQALFVTGDRVNMRAGPGTGFAVIGRFSKGDKLFLLERQGDWARLNGSGTQGPVAGWMHLDYLAPARPALAPVAAAAPKRQVATPTNAEIAKARREIIRQSIASYAGSCPCPYNQDRAGRRCGGRSAWSRPGGYSPVCYDSDISEARLASYLARIRGSN